MLSAVRIDALRAVGSGRAQSRVAGGCADLGDTRASAGPTGAVGHLSPRQRTVVMSRLHGVGEAPLKVRAKKRGHVDIDT